MELRSGYKQTEVGVIPEGWNPRPISTFSAFVTKGATPTTYGFQWEHDGVVFLRSECVSDHGLDLAQAMFISPEAHAALVRGEVRSGDILITITGNVGRVIQLPPDFGYANINQHIARIRINDPDVNPGFVYHYLSQPSIRAHYVSITTGQAYPQISLVQVRETRIPLPKPSEQHAIAVALGDVDALLAALEKLIAKKRDLKQAAMQQLLTGQKRLHGFGHANKFKQTEIGFIPEDWSVSTFKNLFNITAGGDVDPERSKSYQDETYCFPIYSNALTNRGLYGYCSYANHLAGSITITARGTLGVAKFRDHAYTAIGRVLVLLPKGKLDGRFFADIINNRVKFAIESTGVPQLTAPQISTYMLPVPSFPEQTAIANVLSDMDTEIAALEQQLAKTRALKQGMMQELLTGKTRLI